MICTLVDTLTSSEFDQACVLLAKSFPIKYERFGFILNQTPRSRFIVVKDGDKVVGICHMLDRKFPYHSVQLDATSLSFMAVEPAYRNFTVSNLIKKKMFSFLDSSSDISIGIARKAMDSYWYSYGFLGFTNFGEMHLPLKHVKKPDLKFQVHQLASEHLKFVCRLYKEQYAGVLGGLSRDEPLWRFYFEKAHLNQLSLMVVTEDDKVVCYFCSSDNNIHELACSDLNLPNVIPVLAEYVRKRCSDKSNIIFHTGFTHPVSAHIKKLPHEVYSRHVWRGGHILRISSVENLLLKITPVLEERLSAVGVREFQLNFGGFRFEYAESKLAIFKCEDVNNYQLQLSKHTWVALIFGIHDVADMTEFRNNSKINTVRILFPKESPQVPLLDQS